MNTHAAVLTELNALRSAKPSAVAVFAARRSDRIAELEGLLSGLQSEATVNRKVEAALRSARGGDKIGR